MSKIAIMLALALPGAAAAQTLPANIEVPVTLAQEVSSQRMKAGATFDVAVARDVWVDGRVVIPRGTPGRGAVTWRTGKGAFGKSGKIEIEVRSLDMGGRAVPLTGKYREEGQGNTGATIGTIVVAGLVGGAFVTGRSAVFEQGRELLAFTTRPVALGGDAPAVLPAPVLAVATPVAERPAVTVARVTTPAPAPAPVIVAAPVAIAVVAPAAAVASVVDAPAVVRVAAVPVRPIIAMAAPVPVALRAVPSDADLRAEAEDARYRRLMAEQQGVRGGSGQGWSISD